MNRRLSRIAPILLLIFFYAGLFTLINLAVFAALGGSETKIQAYDWVKSAYHYGKRQQIVCYLVACIVSLALMAVIFFGLSHKTFRERFFGKIESYSPASAIWAIFFAMLFNGFFKDSFNIDRNYVGKNPFIYLVLGILTYALGLAITFYLLRRQTRWGLLDFIHYSLPLKPITKRLTIAILGIGVVAVFSLYAQIYQPVLAGRLPFVNEYLNLSSQLNGRAGRTDSIATLNSISATGLNIKDYRNFNQKVDRPVLYSDNQNDLIELAKKFPDNLFYDSFIRGAVTICPMSDELVAYLNDNKLKFGSDTVATFMSDTQKRELRKATPLTDSQKLFLADFSPLMTLQVLSRWYIHHHNFVFGPINKVNLGYDRTKVFFQYGVVGGLIQASTAKMFFGEYNLENYFRAWPIFFILYFGCFLIAVFFLTRKLDMVLVAGVLFLSFIYSQDYEHIFLGPGLNPIRHFLDVFVFVALNRYIRTNKLLDLLLLSVICLFNFCLNPEFGLFCYFAVLVALFFKYMSTKSLPKWPELVVSLVLALLLGYVWHDLRQGTEGVVALYLGGFFSPVLSYRLIMSALTGVLASVTVIAYFQEKLNRRTLIIFASLLAYCLVIMTYCLWGTSWNHVVNISPILILCFIMFLNLIMCSPSKNYLVPRCLYVILALVTLNTSYRYYQMTKKKYETEVSRYDMNTWSIPGARIWTSIPEKPFADATAIIAKYKTGPKIVIFSKFDNILNIMTKTYNALPTNEVMTYMMSEPDRRTLIQRFEEVRPEIVFTDIDIQSPATDELVDPNIPGLGGFYLESSMRLARINNLKTLFTEFSSRYEKIDSMGLISVWRKKN